MSFAARALSVVLFVAATRAGSAAEPAAGEPAPGPATLTLTDGGSVTGILLDSDAPEILRWQGTSFTAPFEFVVPAVSSVIFPAALPPAKPAGDFSFELTGGDVLTGRIRGWSDETVTVESPHFGSLAVRRAAVRRIYRIGENPALIYAGPSGLAGWAIGEPSWQEDGPHLRTEKAGASLTGDFDIPDRAVIEFEVTWKNVPDFVFAIAVDGRSKSDSRLDGWRFETWGDKDRTLALVCERRENADVAEVSTLTAATSPPTSRRRMDMSGVDPFRGAIAAEANGEIDRTHFQPKRASSPPSSSASAKPPVPEKRVHFIAYLDQSAGSLKVFRPDGTPAGEVAVTPLEGRTAGGRAKKTIRIINRGAELRLERLRVARWSGTLPEGSGSGGPRFELADGGVTTGDVAAFREDTEEFVLRGADGERTVSVRDIVAAELPADTPAEGRAVTVTLQDGTRVSGEIGGFPPGEVLVASPDVVEPLRVPHARIRSLAFMESLAAERGEPTPQPPGRAGRLELDGQKLAGSLAPATETSGSSCLAWQPADSRTASPLKPGTAGRVVYRETPAPRPFTRSTGTARALVLVQGRREAAIRRPSQTLPAGPKRREGPPHDLRLRSGDVIPCEVAAIDELGVHITSPVAEAKVVPHASVKAVEFTSGPLPDVRTAKKDRLLTVPRAQKDSPPTHLLHSRTGDLLRCRLVAMTEGTVRVEVQLAEIDIPHDRVSRILWFHEDEIEKSERAGQDPPGVAAANARPPVEAPVPRRRRGQPVQIIRPDRSRTTFEAHAVDVNVVSGASDILGDCRFDLAEIDQIVFGGRIEAEAAELPYAAWRLRPAVEPLVAQDFDESGGDSGTASPLVGQPAPEITLDLLDGGSFRLSQCKGQVVVLDFWASWCGPCIQTMPLTEQAMAEFDPAAVRLVAVNLEEPAEHVRAVMERHHLRAAVALDIDGVAARRYQADAIPQVVVVDREGNVSRVFIGGGREAVEQLKASLTELLSAGGQ